MLLSSVLWNFTRSFKQAIAQIDAGTFGTTVYTLDVDERRHLAAADRQHHRPERWAKRPPPRASQDGSINGAGDRPTRPTTRRSLSRSTASVTRTVGGRHGPSGCPARTTSDRPYRSTSTAGATAPAVELIEITKAFPGVIANDHISLRVVPGEVLCLLGENGAGKSTLMSILSGLYQPDSGQHPGRRAAT